MMEKIRDNFKQKRLFLELTQEGLAKRSGVSLGSIKRFESSGEISLKSLLKLAVVIECLDDFTDIALQVDSAVLSIDDLLKNEKKNTTPKRGRIK